MKTLELSDAAIRYFADKSAAYDEALEQEFYSAVVAKQEELEPELKYRVLFVEERGDEIIPCTPKYASLTATQMEDLALGRVSNALRAYADVVTGGKARR